MKILSTGIEAQGLNRQWLISPQDNVSSVVQEPELSLRPDPGKMIGNSDGESRGV